MKLGLMSAALPQLSFEDLVAWLSKNGFGMIEVACWPKGKAERRYAGVTHIDVASLKKKDVKSIHATLDKHGMQISSLGYYPNPLHPDLEHRQQVIDHLQKDRTTEVHYLSRTDKTLSDDYFNPAFLVRADLSQ